jgi:hypothetical protein
VGRLAVVGARFFSGVEGLDEIEGCRRVEAVDLEESQAEHDLLARSTSGAERELGDQGMDGASVSGHGLSRPV